MGSAGSGGAPGARRRLGRGRRLPYLAALAFALAAAAPSVAEAGYGVQPNSQTISVTVDSAGYVATPSTIDLIVFLDGQDSDAHAWVSDSPAIGALGLPAGRTLASCSPASFRAWTEPGKFVCSISTAPLSPGRTYYWWLDFRRREADEPFPTDRISGPFTFTLQQAAAPPAPTAPAPAAPAAPRSTKTYLSAATLPSSLVFDGSRSVKHSELTSVIYRTMKALGLPRTLAIACWNGADFEAVASSVDIVTHDEDSQVSGFWLGRQPRWLHLAPFVCSPIQDLLDTARPNAIRAEMLTVALHETLHAYGVRNEAQTNCFAVQLVRFAGHFAGLTPTRAVYLEKLAVNITRRNAPTGYWNRARCRDGGVWDLAPGVRNLG